MYIYRYSKIRIRLAGDWWFDVRVAAQIVAKRKVNNNKQSREVLRQWFTLALLLCMALLDFIVDDIIRLYILSMNGATHALIRDRLRLCTAYMRKFRTKKTKQGATYNCKRENSNGRRWWWMMTVDDQGGRVIPGSQRWKKMEEPHRQNDQRCTVR